MTIVATAALSQTACYPVQENFGSPVDTTLLHDPAFGWAITEVADNAAAANVHARGDLETGVAAARAMKALGCASCSLAKVCTVGAVLQEKVTVGQGNQQLLAETEMLASAPGWLTAARLHQAGVDPATVPTTPDAVSQAIAAGTLDLAKLRGTTANHLETIHVETETLPPELQAIKSLRIDQRHPVESHRITNTYGDNFLVTDASDAIPFSGEPPTPEDYAILTSKLLTRMQQRDANGKPQVIHPDQIMQKALGIKIGNAQMHEIRMNGKNRLYVLVDTATGNQPTRVSILGSHAGDARTQRDFLDKAIALH